MRTERARGLTAVAGLTLACLGGVGAGAVSAQDAAAADAAGEPAGEQLLSLREAGVLPPGQFETGFLFDNYDRDPLGIDVVDGGFSLRLGVVERAELYFGYQITRSVSTPGSHPVPSPPLDVVVLNGGVPLAPYRAMYWPMPYLDHAPARVDEWVPGEYTIGARTRLLSQRGLRPALSLSAQLTAPGTTARFDLAKGSGSGVLDFGFHSAASWGGPRLRLSANLGLSLNGDLDPSDRFIVVGDASPAREAAIQRPAFLHGGLGLRLRVWRGVAAVAELSGWGPIGGRTPMQSESGASELLAGLLVQVKALTFAAGLRWHLAPQSDGLTLETGPLAGGLDLSGVSAADRDPILAVLGADSPRHDANVVVLGWPAGMPIPEGALRLPATYQTSTRGNLGVALRVSARLGR